MVEVNNLNKLCGISEKGDAITVTDSEIRAYVKAYKDKSIGGTYERENISLPLMNAGLKKLQEDLYLNPESNTEISIAKLKNEIEMTAQVCGSGLSAINDVNNAYEALGKDVNDFNNVIAKQKRHINELRDNFELTRSEREKEISINVYYAKLYDAYLDALKIIVLFSFILVILALLNNYEIISDSIQLYLSLTVIILCGVITLRKLMDIYNRSPHNFDEYDWKDGSSASSTSKWEYNKKNFSRANNPRAPGATRNKVLLGAKCPGSSNNTSLTSQQNTVLTGILDNDSISDDQKNVLNQLLGNNTQTNTEDDSQTDTGNNETE